MCNFDKILREKLTEETWEKITHNNDDLSFRVILAMEKTLDHFCIMEDRQECAKSLWRGMSLDHSNWDVSDARIKVFVEMLNFFKKALG